jgi:hypothetical protein
LDFAAAYKWQLAYETQKSHIQSAKLWGYGPIILGMSNKLDIQPCQTFFGDGPGNLHNLQKSHNTISQLM